MYTPWSFGPVKTYVFDTAAVWGGDRNKHKVFRLVEGLEFELVSNLYILDSVVGCFSNFQLCSSVFSPSTYLQVHVYILYTQFIACGSLAVYVHLLVEV